MENEDNIYFGKDGRLRVYVKKTGKTVSYPRYLMKKALGRELLSDEDVHHKDKNPLNNDITNLVVMKHSEHTREHMTKFFDTVAICGWCGKEFVWTAKHQKNFYSNKRNHGHKADTPFCSRECSGRYGKQLQLDNGCNQSPRRKLTDEQIRYIRKYYKPYDKNYSTRALASKFGVDKSVISLIVSGVTYKDVR